MGKAKYKKGEFGYWWTITMGNQDIEGKVWHESIYASRTDLTSLKGAPSVILRDFFINNNNITSLEGGPKVVMGNFKCQNNNLKTLNGAPIFVEKEFSYASNPNLYSLDGLPSYIGSKDEEVKAKDSIFVTIDGVERKLPANGELIIEAGGNQITLEIS